MEDKTYYMSYTQSRTATFYYYSGSAATSTTATANRYMNYVGSYVDVDFTIPTEVTDSTGPESTSYSHISTSKTGTSAVTPTTSTLTYYAVYKKTVQVVLRTYNSNSEYGGVGTAYGYYDGSTKYASIKLETQYETPDGYTARGWSTSAAANAPIEVAINGTATLINSTTYYMSYSYTVTATYSLSNITNIRATDITIQGQQKQQQHI